MEETEWLCRFSCGGTTVKCESVWKKTRADVLEWALRQNLPKDKNGWPREGDTVTLDIWSKLEGEFFSS